MQLQQQQQQLLLLLQHREPLLCAELDLYFLFVLSLEGTGEDVAATAATAAQLLDQQQQQQHLQSRPAASIVRDQLPRQHCQKQQQKKQQQ